MRVALRVSGLEFRFRAWAQGFGVGFSGLFGQELRAYAGGVGFLLGALWECCKATR